MYSSTSEDVRVQPKERSASCITCNQSYPSRGCPSTAWTQPHSCPSPSEDGLQKFTSWPEEKIITICGTEEPPHCVCSESAAVPFNHGTALVLGLCGTGKMNSSYQFSLNNIFGINSGFFHINFFKWKNHYMATFPQFVYMES